MNVLIKTVGWDDPDGAALRAAMREEMSERYADRISARVDRQAEAEEALAVEGDEVDHVAVAYTSGGTPVGHAALRRRGPDMELKRMYVTPESRGHGIARLLLDDIERAARESGAERVVLHTGDRQPDAVRLYERAGYRSIAVFAPYHVLEGSICMAKTL